MYEGKFERGLMSGTGIMFYADGKTYEGQFREDKYNGHGTLRSARGNIIYKGEFVDGHKVVSVA